MQSIDINKLTSTLHANPTAEAVLERLLQRERARETTDVTRLYSSLRRMHKDASKSLLERLFKELEGLGLGKSIYGARGGIKRFKWHYNLVSIAKASQGKGELAQFKPKSSIHLPKIVTTGTVDRRQVDPNYRILIRRGDIEVSTAIPRTSEDLNKLIELISKLK